MSPEGGGLDELDAMLSDPPRRPRDPSVAEMLEYLAFVAIMCTCLLGLALLVVLTFV